MDPLTIGAIAAPIIGGLFGKSGQSSANAANARQAALNREFQAGETALQRDFSAGEAQKTDNIKKDSHLPPTNAQWQT